ncbi:ATPase [candidate division WOR-1 bacterium RIFCSPHIGHO2_02_FULL_53_26]|nr:MAG: ATPase [candidate division WOR-1 bacterium RIFCSPHIGHO2_02_FULL_53_26]
MYSRLLKPPKAKSFFLFGPRGTGKTTWVKATFPSGLYLDLLEAELFNDLLANPQRLEKLIPRNFNDWIVIDEVQRVPELLNEVHRLIENYKYQFVLTGSSARKLKRRGPNLLAGRALTLSMHQLTAKELGADFKIDHSLKFGQLPSAYVEADPKAYLESYVKTYLEEEIQQEGLTRNVGAFSRFLETASFSQGAVLNVSSLAREAAIERKVVENYFTILEDLLIAYRIPVFTKKAKRRMLSHPKFYFFDVGLYRTLRPAGPLDRPEEIEGAALESLLFQELKAINDTLDLGYKIFYWRTSNEIEVDFVLYGERGILAFEIKRTGKINPAAVRGLKAFKADYPAARTFLLYSGERRMSDGEIEIIPIKEALKDISLLLT